MDDFRNLNSISSLAMERHARLLEEIRVGKELGQAPSSGRRTSTRVQKVALALAVATLAALFTAQSVTAALGGGGAGSRLLM